MAPKGILIEVMAADDMAMLVLSVISQLRNDLMSTKKPRLATKWKRIASDLGLDVVAPFELILSSSNRRIHVPVLIRNFGGPKSMVIVADYSESFTDGWAEEAVQEGYGFSVMSEPAMNEEYAREVSMEVLADWGWYGPESDRPEWLDRLPPLTE